MDRRQRKTRDAIFHAFTDLLKEKTFDRITVGDIVKKADIGRATFYAHFEAKECVLKALCEDLFCHIFDAAQNAPCEHSHLFTCDAPNSIFLHLFQHLQNNDHQILALLASQNNDLFLQYFKSGMIKLIESQFKWIRTSKANSLPRDFWVNHVASSFVETFRWWNENHRKETPEQITAYFLETI